LRDYPHKGLEKNVEHGTTNDVAMNNEKNLIFPDFTGSMLKRDKEWETHYIPPFVHPF